MRGRPRMITSYRDAMSIFRTGTTRVWFIALVVLAFLLPMRFESSTVQLLGLGALYAIGAIGLNLVTGYAGQVSLGHAFFLAVGAYTATVISGATGETVYGFGITEMWIWIPAAGLVAGLFGLAIGPIATRLRGLYLAIVTLGLVFVGDHILREWGSLTGGVGFGRPSPQATLFGKPALRDGELFGMFVGSNLRFYWISLVLLIVLGFLAKNLVRSRDGRAFAAVRDRDIAAEVMGVNLTRQKLIAFSVSSAYAGVAGALFAVRLQTIEPTNFNLLLSILFIAMVLIGGGASIAGSVIGGFAIALLPEIAGPLTGVVTPVFDTLIFWKDGGFPLNEFEFQQVLYGGLLVAFLLAEPRGIFGLWLRVRNYWKAFPFSY